MRALADVKHYPQNPGIAAVQGLLQGWLQSPAFTAIEVDGLYCCIEVDESDLAGEIGVPYTWHAVLDPLCKCLSHFQILLS